MKKLFTSFLMTLIMVSAAFAGAVQPTPVRQGHRGVQLTPEQMKTVLAIHPWLKPKSGLSTMKSRLAGVASVKPSHLSPMRINPSGSNIQGWRTVDGYGESPNGWYELGLDGSEKFLWDYHDPDWVDDGWSEEPGFPFNSGFWRNGKVYGFHSEMVLFWLIWGHGKFTLDGEISDYVTYGEDYSVTDFSTYVLSCAYDQDKDIVYAYTLNPDATTYMFRSVNPETWEFTTINSDVKIDNVCVGFCYNPEDKQIYGMTPDSRLVTVNPSTGETTMKAKYDLTVTTALEGMIYSPLDKCFVFVYSDGTSNSILYTIDPVTFALEKRADLYQTLQYKILVTPDKLLDPKVPLVPEIVSVSFVEGSHDGTATLKMPTKTFDGSELSGTLTIRTLVDGTLKGETTGHPGATVEIPLNNVAEGTHTFSFTIVSGEFESAEVQKSVYVGFDTPKTPQNLRLETSSLVWDAVTEGVSGGYVDCDALTYNVYLNGEKINESPIAATSYEFDMPEETFRKYVAQVEAVNHGHVSDRGFSNDIKHGNPFPLPFTMTPTFAESELVKTLGSTHMEYFNWHYTEDEECGYFACYMRPYGDGPNRWLFMPAVSVHTTDKLVEISFDVKCEGYEENEQNLTVGLSSDQTPESFVPVRNFEKLKNNVWEKITVWCYCEAGTTYLTFKSETDDLSYQILVRNIAMKVSDRPSTTPTAVENLTATALPKGELKAKVSFSLPVLDAAGNPLADTQLTATVRSAVATETVKGAPGSAHTVEIATVNGFNSISVTADNAVGGIESSVNIFTGLDAPQALSDIRFSNSEDYKSLHLKWDAPTEGANGGYVNPADVTYSLCLYNPETYEWEVSRHLGSVTSFDYTPELNGDGIETIELAIRTSNEAGSCGMVRVINAPVGNPYTLPMAEIFGQREYGPKFSAFPDDSYVSEWGYIHSAYPYWVSQPTPDGSAAYLCSGSTGQKARIVLPAFSTEGISAAGLEIPVWCGPQAGEISIYAQTFGIEPELIGSFSNDEVEGWIKHRFHLPAKFMDKKWVYVMIDAVFDGDEQIAGFGQFKIQTFVDKDIAVTSVGVPSFPMIGSPAEISAEIENFGLNNAEEPQLEINVSRGETMLATLPMERVDGEGELPELGSATFRTEWTPDAESEGKVKFTVRVIGSDMNSTNDFRTAEAIVGKGNNAVVTDLNAEETESGIILTWTDPTVETGHEGFESMAPFSYGDRIGDFKNVCRDGLETTYIGTFRYPHDNDIKAWQVLSEKEITEIMAESNLENSNILAASGDRFIAVFIPLSYFVGEGLESDRWLISPEIKANSMISFMMTAGVEGMVENVQILASSTDDNPDSFVVIEDHKILSAEWRKYEYTLPEDAKYFAIRYCGDSDNSFFVLVDDIEYVPAAESPVLEGFDIYRDGAVIAEATKVRGSWTDPAKPDSKTVSYNIVPVVSRNGVITRGMMSNTAVVSTSAIDEIEAEADPTAVYFNLQGIRVKNPGRGIYIKLAGSRAKKVLID